MNRKTMFSFIATLLVLAPLAAFAQTNTTLTALQQQIAALQQQLMSLQGKQSGHGGGSSPSMPTIRPLPPDFPPRSGLPPGDQPEDEDTTASITFNRDLYLGLRNDPDVSNLQEFLTDQGFYNQTISGNFFILTRNAVKKFQQAHGIRPSGYFGSLTRTVANKIFAGTEVLPPIETPPPVPVSLGHLTIDPAYAMVKIGETQPIRAIFAPPRSACLDAHPSCKVLEQAPYEVQALFTSDNPKIAIVDEIPPACPAPPPGIQSSCPDPLHFVRGVSEGETIITATYSDYRTAHVARMKVSVGGGATSQNLPPVVYGLKGPTTLKVNEAGTWTIQAHDPENSSLAYHITWGDEEIGVPRVSQAPVAAEPNTQTATFTHAYAKAGTFAPLFVVVDEDNLSAKTSASVVIGSGMGGIFSIADVSGVQSAYVPGQQIKLAVKSIEPDGSPATSGEGFNVQTYIYDAGRTKTYAGVNGTYNAGTGYWDVLLDAPSASNVSYDLEVFLYCSNDSAVCTKYGRAAQVTKLFKFTLAPSAAPSITILSPNGGEVWLVGTKTIKWTGGSDTTGIYLYRDAPNASCGFCNFTSVIASGVSADQGQYAWTIPNTLAPGSTFYIRLLGGSSADNSDAPFSIVQP